MQPHRLIVLLILAVLVVDPTAAAGETAATSLEERYRAAAEALAGSGAEALVMPPEDMAGDRGQLAALIGAEGRWTDLSPGERAGILVALADQTALEGDRAQARTLYGILENDGPDPLRGWATYMLAGLEFAAGSYAAAAARYERACGLDEPGPWREHACAMAGLAARLDELRLTGGEHGDPVPATP